MCGGFFYAFFTLSVIAHAGITRIKGFAVRALEADESALYSIGKIDL